MLNSVFWSSVSASIGSQLGSPPSTWATQTCPGDTHQLSPSVSNRPSMLTAYGWWTNVPHSKLSNLQLPLPGERTPSGIHIQFWPTRTSASYVGHSLVASEPCGGSAKFVPTACSSGCKVFLRWWCITRSRKPQNDSGPASEATNGCEAYRSLATTTTCTHCMHQEDVRESGERSMGQLCLSPQAPVFSTVPQIRLHLARKCNGFKVQAGRCWACSVNLAVKCPYSEPSRNLRGTILADFTSSGRPRLQAWGSTN